MSESDSEIEQDQEDLQEGTEEDHLSDLLPRIRILTIFAYWWEELENVVYSDTTRTIRCLHVLSRIIEDSTFASSSDSSEISSALTTTNANNTSNHSLTTSLKEEFHTICERLVKVVIEDFADVAYSVFQLASTSSDANLLKALTRFLVAFKNACVKTSEDFYAIFQTISLEGFITNFLQFNDLITSARVAYIAGELIEDTNSDAPVEINAFIGSSIRHFQQSFERSTALVDQIPRLLARLFERTRYLFDNSIVLPLPQHVHRNQDAPEEEEQRNNNEWFIDDCDDVNSLDFHLSVAIGYLRLLGSVADYTETLTPVIEADFVTLCLKVLEFPLFDLQSVALSWFGSAMAHKRIATEFIEKSGIQRLIYFMNQPEHLEYHDTKAQHVSFITVALAKHSQVMDQFIQDETVASSLVAFGLQMLQEKSMDTQLNIIEWFGDCFGHPFMLTAVNQTNVLAVILAKIEYSFQEDEKLQKTEQMVLLNHSLRREAIRSVLKYLVFNLFYAVQYTKKVDQRQSASVTKSPAIKSRSHSSSSTANASWLHSQPAHSRHEFSWLNSINMIKLDEAALAEQELYVIQSIIDNGTLPRGMKTDLFHAFDNDFTSNSVLLSGIKEDDTISIASTVKKSTTEWIIAKQFMQHNVIPIILKALLFESKDSSMYALALSILELLCLDYTMILEIQHCQVSPFVPSLDSPNSTTSLLSLTVDTHPQQSSSNQLKKGIEILLATISQDSRKDPSIVTSALRVLSAMCTPPHFRYKGNNVSKAKSLLSEVMNRKHASAIAASASGGLTSNSGTAFSASKKITVSSSKKNPIGFPSGFTVGVIFGRLEQIQKGVRTAIRSYSGITSLVQLIHYKKNQFYIITIRLETIKVLIGIAHDNEIKLILSKMRIPTILENQIKFEHSNDYDGVNNAPVVAKTIEKELLFLYSDSLIKLLTKSSMEGITDENVDASQELLDRKAIVEHSHIEFNEAELMYLIKDHLISKGLTQTVELLEKEMAEKEKPRVLVLSQSSNTTTAGLIEGVALSQASIETVPASQKSQAATLTIPRTPHSGSNNPAIAKSDSRKRNMDTVLDDAEPSNQILSQQELAVAAIDNGPFMSAEGAAKRARRSVSPLLISTDSIPPLPESNEMIKTQQQTYRVKSPVPRSIRAKNVRRAFKEEFLVKNNTQQEQKERVSLTPTPFHSQVTPSDSAALSRQSSLVPTSPTSKGYDAAKATKPLPLIGHSTPTASCITAFTNSQSAQKKTFVHYPAPQPSHSQSHSHSHAHGHSHHGHGHNSQGKANNHVPSKLSNIMHRYLKLQHQQCKHPITTLPILSLQKAHACPKPSISSYSSSHKQPSHNIYSLHSRKFAYSNTSWYNNYYRKHDYQQQLSFIYSNYRTIKSFRELESPSAMTSMVFSKKLNQLYIAFNDYTMEEDPGIALVDILTGETSVSGHNGLQGTIMNLTLSPHDFLMLTAISPGDLDFHHLETVLEHELYLWKDPSDITIFDSPALKKFQCKSEAELASLSSSLYIPHEQQQRMNYFHAEAFDPFHQNRLAALKINDFFHQSHQPGGNNTANGPALTTNQRSLTATSGTSANTNNTNTNNNNNNNASDDHQSSSYIFDIETGQILDVLYNDGNSDTYNLPKITYHAHYPSLYFMDGKLWDLRINQIIHKFDKLSNYGNIAIHPHKAEVIIDHALWDLRNFSLVQMIPSIEHCILQFHPVENILYGYTSILDDEHLLEKIFHLPSYTSPVTSKGGNHHHDGSSNGGNYFHVLHGTEYSHITTEYIEKEYFNIMSLQVDPFHNGYLSTLLFNIHDANDSIVRIYEIGKRRKVVGDDSDDEGEEDDSEAEDEEWRDVSEEEDDDDEEEDDEEDEDEDDSLMDEDEEDDEEIEVISENDDAEEGNEVEGDDDDDDESYVEGEDEGEDAEGDDAEEGGGEEEGGDDEEEEEGEMDEEDHIIDLIQSIANRSSFSDQLRSRLNRRRPSLREEDSRPRTNRRSRLRRRNSNQQEASNEEEQEEKEEV